MPATRTSSRQQLLRNSSEVNSTSSPELVARTTSASATKRKRGHAAKPKPVMLGEVIEISSDDEPTPPLNPVLVELRRQVRKLKEENARYKADLAKSDSELLSAREEILGLKASPTHGKGKLVLDISQLEDNVNCEICTLRMWSPFILPECGHTFCQSCLQDWFDTTLAQFMTAHPHYDVNDPVPNNLRQWQAMMHSPHVVQNPHTAAYITQMLRQTPQPDYTCPTCREAVKNRPVEDFTLKALVRTVATATGDASPRKPEKPGRVKAKASISRESGPWDIFFPRAT